MSNEIVQSMIRGLTQEGVDADPPWPTIHPYSQCGPLLEVLIVSSTPNYKREKLNTKI
jgi:hypothetical protein